MSEIEYILRIKLKHALDQAKGQGKLGWKKTLVCA